MAGGAITDHCALSYYDNNNITPHFNKARDTCFSCSTSPLSAQYIDSDLCVSISGATATPRKANISSGTQLTFIRRDEGRKEIVRKQMNDDDTIDDRSSSSAITAVLVYTRGPGPRSLRARRFLCRRHRQNQYDIYIYIYKSYNVPLPLVHSNKTNELN